MSDISIIIPCKDHEADLKYCLETIFKQETNGFNFEIIVVNSHSRPEVDDALLEFLQIKKVTSTKPADCGLARNVGYQISDGQILVFTDADCLPAPGWLNAIWEGFQQDIELACGPVLDSRPFNIISSADNFIQLNQYPQSRSSGPARLLPGGNMAIRRKTFEAVGCFEDVKVAEDSRLIAAVRKQFGNRIHFLSGMAIYHVGVRSWKRYFHKNYGYGHSRGEMLDDIKMWQARVGAWYVGIPLVIFRRMNFIFSQVVKYQIQRLPLFFLLSPVILAGLICWAIGFKSGCEQALETIPEDFKEEDL